jgi:CheY-like chemotaxis protein
VWLPEVVRKEEAMQRLDVDVIEAAEETIHISVGAFRVLVVDDDPTVRELMRRALGREGFRVETASGGKEGLEMARSIKPDVITLDVMMPDLDGWSVLTALKDDPELKDIPVIIMTIVDNRNLGFALGAAAYLTKPIDRANLLSLLDKYRSETPRGFSGRVLIVEDDVNTRDMIRRTLAQNGWNVFEASNGVEGLERLPLSKPHVILLDLMMPEMDGFQFIAELHRGEGWQNIPIVVMTAKDLTAVDRQRLNGAVEQVIQKGMYTREALLNQVRSLVAQYTGRME